MSEPRRFWLLLTLDDRPLAFFDNALEAIRAKDEFRQTLTYCQLIEVQEIPKAPK